jgi:hypothetical protein
MPIEPRLPARALRARRPMRGANSGRTGGRLALAARGSPGGGASDNSRAAAATPTNAQRQFTSAARPPTSGDSDCPAAWKLA